MRLYPHYMYITGWVEVQWDHGGVNSYRMGAEGKFDLEMTGEEPTIPPPPPSEDESTPEQDDEECEDEVWPNVAQCVFALHIQSTIHVHVFVCFSTIHVDVHNYIMHSTRSCCSHVHYVFFSFLGLSN